MIGNIQYDLETQNSFDLYGQEIYLDCNNYFLKESEKLSKSIENSIIFSPNHIKKEMLSFSKLIEQPNKFAYATFITSPDIKYIFLDSSYSKLLINELPNNIDVSIQNDISKIKKSGYYKLNIITFGIIPNSQSLNPTDTDNENITLIYVDILRDKGNFPNSFGIVSFYKKINNQFQLVDESYFFDPVTLLGAIYSENKENHMCNLHKSIKKLNLISKIKLDRANDFSNTIKLKNCPYTKSIDLLNQLILKTNEPSDTKTYFEDIYIRSTLIKQENNMLKRLSCPLLY